MQTEVVQKRRSNQVNIFLFTRIAGFSYILTTAYTPTLTLNNDIQ